MSRLSPNYHLLVKNLKSSKFTINITEGDYLNVWFKQD